MGGLCSRDSQQEGAQLAAEELTASNIQQSQQKKTQTAEEEGKLRKQQSLQEKAKTVGEEGKLRKRRSQQEKAQTVGEEGKLRKWRSQQEKAQRAGEEAKSQSVKFPHNYRAAETQLPDHEQLKSGVFLNQNREKHWIEEKTGAKSFMLFARELSITWADNPEYWSWFSVKETSDVDVEVAYLLKVCWLEVGGKFETSNLSANILYEVVFVVLMDDAASGWNDPVTLRLTCPDGKVQERKEGLKQKPRGEWMELHAGDFRTSTQKGGELRFILLNYSGNWKKGLVVKGAVIRPKMSGGSPPGLTAPS